MRTPSPAALETKSTGGINPIDLDAEKVIRRERDDPYGEVDITDGTITLGEQESPQKELKWRCHTEKGDANSAKSQEDTDQENVRDFTPILAVSRKQA